MKSKRVILSDIIFVVIILLLVTLSIFSYHAINRFNVQSEWVSRTNLTKLKLEQIQSGIKEAEIGLRFYLITRDSTYLAGSGTTVATNSRFLAEIDSLTKDNPLQQMHLRALESLLDKRSKGLYESINKGFGNIDTQTSVRRNMMNAISGKIAAMENIEDALLKKRIRERNEAAILSPLSFLLLSIFILVVVVFAYVALRSETRLRFNAEDDIKKLNDYFKDLPAVFAVVKGAEHVHEIANSFYQEICGNQDPVNKSFREVFPELYGQGFFEILDNVYADGKPAIGKEIPITITRKNQEAPQKSFFNFIYQPLFDDRKHPTGILIFGYEITEMIEARNEVEETEQRSRLAIEAANIGTFDWDIEHANFKSSPRLMEIFGYQQSQQDVSHQDLINRFHPDDIDIRNKAVNDSFATGSLRYEARIIWSDASLHWVNVYGKILRNTGNETLRMFGTAIDITEQKNALEELRESEATFRLLADSMPQFVWTGDVEGNLDYFNETVFSYTGLNKQSIQELGWINIVHPDDREENIKRWMRSVATGNEFIFEHRFKNKNGEYRWQLSRALPQRDDRGVIQRWVGTSTDIQDQKNLAHKLEMQINERTRELSQLNKALLIRNNIFTQAEENALIGSYSWNLQTGELEYSDNLFRLFGYEPNEFQPSFEKYHSMIHPDDKEQVLKDGMETKNNKQLSAHTYRIITKSGKIKHFRSTGKIFGEADNTILIGTVQDISQDTMLNEILRIKNLQLERSNAELESFNYIASHDLQEPLRKIQAFSQRLLQKEGDHFTAFGRDYFERINSSAARMQNLINALLSYSKADALLKEAGKVNLNQVIESVIVDLQDVVDEKQAIIEFNNLPYIHAVSIQVHQLFTNLISNAIKYSKATIPPHIRITGATVPGTEIQDYTANKKLIYWKIQLADNGIGFEQEYGQKIFELFQRLHNTNDYEGTGIGLAICKKIMRNHQGYITATGQAGVGAVFTIYFPFSV